MTERGVKSVDDRRRQRRAQYRVDVVLDVGLVAGSEQDDIDSLRVVRVAVRRIRDILRATFTDDEAELELTRQIDPRQARAPVQFTAEVADEQLALIFVCCHPALARPASVALTLKVVCGFGVAEIARAFLTNDIAINQRLVRAKRTLRDMSIAQNISARCQRYLGDMGVNLQVWLHAMETPHDKLFVFKPDELKSLALVTEQPFPTKARL